MNPRHTFKIAFCTRFEYSQEKFERGVFWNAMDPEIIPVAFLIRCLRPSFFRSDLECIRHIATAENQEEVRSIVNSLQFDPTFKQGFLRGLMGIRISGRRLMRLAGKVW